MSLLKPPVSHMTPMPSAVTEVSQSRKPVLPFLSGSLSIFCCGRRRDGHSLRTVGGGLVVWLLLRHLINPPVFKTTFKTTLLWVSGTWRLQSQAFWGLSFGFSHSQFGTQLSQVFWFSYHSTICSPASKILLLCLLSGSLCPCSFIPFYKFLHFHFSGFQEGNINWFLLTFGCFKFM